MSETIQPAGETRSNNEALAKESLPNATAVLVMGILSIIFCWCWGFIGLILGIIGLILGTKSRKIYKEDPDRYSLSSYKNLNAGYICSLIGTILSGLFVLTLIVSIIFGLAIGSNFIEFLPWDDILNNY